MSVISSVDTLCYILSMQSCDYRMKTYKLPYLDSHRETDTRKIAWQDVPFHSAKITRRCAETRCTSRYIYIYRITNIVYCNRRNSILDNTRSWLDEFVYLNDSTGKGKFETPWYLKLFEYMYVLCVLYERQLHSRFLHSLVIQVSDRCSMLRGSRKLIGN